MRAFEISECQFGSGSRARYLFAQLGDDLYADDLAELADFPCAGPFRESASESSPIYQEFLLSRYLLLQLLKDFKRRSVGGVAVSISHTRGAALVAGCATLEFEGAALAAGVGADLESRERKISEAVFQRLLTTPEERDILPLDLWCLKEAAFKAHPQNDGLLLSDFTVLSGADREIRCNKTGRKFEAVIQDGSFKRVFARLI